MSIEGSLQINNVSTANIEGRIWAGNKNGLFSLILKNLGVKEITNETREHRTIIHQLENDGWTVNYYGGNDYEFVKIEFIKGGQDFIIQSATFEEARDNCLNDERFKEAVRQATPPANLD